MSKFIDRYTNNTTPITLEDVTFHVRLPTTTNKRFQRAVTGAVMEFDKEGNAQRKDLSVAEFVEAQVEAFIRTSIDKVDGWPEFTVDALLAMPEACDDLWDLVTRETADAEAEAEAVEKKPEPILSGPESGPGNTSSIEDSKRLAG